MKSSKLTLAACLALINYCANGSSLSNQQPQVLHPEDNSYGGSMDSESAYTLEHQPQSFMDLIYGDIVNGEFEAQRTLQMLQNREILPPTEDYSPFIRADYQDLATIKSASTKSKVQTHNDETYNEQSMKNFIVHSTLKHYKKPNLPDSDYTEDLYKDISFFGGLNTFGNTQPVSCFNAAHLNDSDKYNFDIAVVGAGFDTGTSFKPGARFGPRSIRLASKRLGFGVLPVRGFLNRYYNDEDAGDDGEEELMANLDVFNYMKVVDCGDVPMTPFDNRIALNQLYRAHRLIHKYPAPALNGSSGSESFNPADKGLAPWTTTPKVITLGGDHTITLLTVKSAFEKFGQPITVLHFDSHLDSWDPKVMGGEIRSDYFELNHGTFLHYAAEKGYINKNNSMHVGIRAPLIDENTDLVHDRDCGFDIVYAREIDYIGIKGILNRIKKRVYGTTKVSRDQLREVPVFITFDIDVLDPVYAPGTGTAEPGGFTIREILNIVDGLEGINLIGADLVEVSPLYDTAPETTSLNAAQIVDSFVGLMAAFKYRELN